MRVRSTIVLCGVFAFIGGWVAFERSHADPRRGVDLDLDSSTNALRDAGRVMAKISKQISPSVVHIESVHRTVLRGEVEETGSGVIVKSSHLPGEFVVTNRHVAESFAAAKGESFALRLASNGKTVKPSLDWRREYQRPAESIVGVDEVLWINPDEKPDIALLHIGPVDGDGTASPEPIPLMTVEEVKATLGNWAAVIGYPARSPYNNLADQQRIFDGVYDVKRLAPGTIMAVSPDGLFRHDATTLGGNSGSVVVDLASGKAIGLHFGGIEGERNEAVQAPVLADLITAHC